MWPSVGLYLDIEIMIWLLRPILCLFVYFVYRDINFWYDSKYIGAVLGVAMSIWWPDDLGELIRRKSYLHKHFEHRFQRITRNGTLADCGAFTSRVFISLWRIEYFWKLRGTRLGPLLLTWFNFNPSMDKQSHTPVKCGMKLLIHS